MVEQEIEIINRLGLHARAAAKLVNTAAKFASNSNLIFGSQEADCKSIMSVMMLAAGKGSTVIVRCDGNDEQLALAEITDLINDYFGEEE